MLRPFHALPLALKTLACLLLLCGAASAQITTYSYRGQPYDAQGDAIEGFFVLQHPLAPNTQVTITPDIEVFIPDSKSDIFDVTGGTTFNLTTDANGNIIAWSFTADMDWACICTEQLASSNTAFDTYTLIKYPYPNQVTGPSAKAGTWTTFAGSPAAIQGTLTWWTARAWTLQGELTTAQQRATSYANGYIAANATIAELNAALVAEKQQVALCRARKGVC